MEKIMLNSNLIYINQFLLLTTFSNFSTKESIIKQTKLPQNPIHRSVSFIIRGLHAVRVT